MHCCNVKSPLINYGGNSYGGTQTREAESDWISVGSNKCVRSSLVGLVLCLAWGCSVNKTKIPTLI